jgi:hypothetical protein
VSENFTKRTLPRRIIALAAAYAIALSGLLASFGAAQAAAAATALPAGVICHNTVADQPASDETNGKLCVASCCIGCLMMTAALPPPPANAAPLPRSLSHRLGPLEISALPGGNAAKSHRSRAPPLGA